MNILVAGGAGFIGSHLCDALIEKGNKIIVADKLIMGKQNIKHLEENTSFKFYEMELANQENVDRLFTENDINVVYHMAANSDIQKGGDSNNTALWFVKWLIVFSLLSPVIMRLIDNKKVFVVFEIIVTIIILIFKIPYYSILYWTPFYLLGAYIGHSYYELFYLIVSLNMKKQAAIILSSILMILSGIFFIMIKWQSYYAILYLRFIGTLCTLGLLFSLPIFKNDKHYKIFDYTFPIYCMHVPVVGIFKHFLRGVIGFIFIPILVIGSLFYVSVVVKNRMPRLYSILFGR